MQFPFGPSLYPSIPAFARRRAFAPQASTGSRWPAAAAPTLASLLVFGACGSTEAQPEAPGAAVSTQPSQAMQTAKAPQTTPAPDPAPIAQADHADLLGCWKIHISLPFGAKRTGKLCIEADDAGELSARMQIKGEWRDAKAVRASPGRVEIDVVGPVGPATMAADYTASSMTGTFSAKVGKRPFSGERIAD